MTTPNKKLLRMNHELWESYTMFTDHLRRRGDPALVKAVIKDVYQLYRVMSGMDASEAANPQLQTAMGEELAQAYDLFCKEPLRSASDPIVVLDVMKDLGEIGTRMEENAELESGQDEALGARPGA